MATTRGAVFIGSKDLKSYLREELKFMIMFVKCIVKLGHTHVEGNPFVQFLNDYVTLKNRHKCMPLGLGMVDPNLK